VQAMLDGVKTNNDTVIMSAVEAIKQQPLPPKGDRKIARAANDAGLAALKANVFDEAIAKLADGVRADPSDQEIVNNLGYAYMMAGRLADAQASFRSALMLAPTRSSAWANLAMVMAKEGRADEGLSAYLLAFKYSQNQVKTREFLTKQSQEDTDPKVRELAAKVLQTIGPQ
jgi:Flp pilus assembly protein TadD